MHDIQSTGSYYIQAQSSIYVVLHELCHCCVYTYRWRPPPVYTRVKFVPGLSYILHNVVSLLSHTVCILSPIHMQRETTDLDFLPHTFYSGAIN